MSDTPRLSHTLQSRHVAMISLGGIIGAGLFVGSSAAIASIGPAVILCYILAGILILFSMRMLGELAVAHSRHRLFHRLRPQGLGHPFGFVGGWLYWYFWMVVVAVEAIAGASIIAQWIAASLLADRAGAFGVSHRRQSDVGPFLWRIRVLVFLHQGGGDHRLHPGDRVLMCWD